MSRILEIYDAVAALSVTAGGQTPGVLDLDQLTDQTWPASLPKRFLLPTGSFGAFGGGEIRTARFLGVGDFSRLIWSIRDLCLWRPTGSGIGLMDVSADIVSYAGAYATILTRNRNLIVDSQIDTFTIVPGVYEWPAQSGNSYWGIDCILTVSEFVS